LQASVAGPKVCFVLRGDGRVGGQVPRGSARVGQGQRLRSEQPTEVLVFELPKLDPPRTTPPPRNASYFDGRPVAQVPGRPVVRRVLRL